MSTGLVVMGTHVLKVVGLNPCTVFWSDIFTNNICSKNLKVCLKRTKITEKEAGDSPFFN